MDSLFLVHKGILLAGHRGLCWKRTSMKKGTIWDRLFTWQTKFAKMYTWSSSECSLVLQLHFHLHREQVEEQGQQPMSAFVLSPLVFQRWRNVQDCWVLLPYNPPPRIWETGGRDVCKDFCSPGLGMAGCTGKYSLIVILLSPTTHIPDGCIGRAEHCVIPRLVKQAPVPLHSLDYTNLTGSASKIKCFSTVAVSFPVVLYKTCMFVHFPFKVLQMFHLPRASFSHSDYLREKYGQMLHFCKGLK